MPKWELYQDPSYYDMYAVRDASDRSFNSPRLFHFSHKADADMFIELLNRSKCAEGIPCQTK